MRITSLLCSFFIASLFLISCQPELPSNLNTNTGCRLSKAYSYFTGSGTIADSAEFTYAANRITRVNLNSDYYFTLDYSNEKITKRNFFNSATNASEGYDLLSYNADGTIKKIDRFDNSGTPQIWELIEFNYSQGKLVKAKISDDDGSGNLLPVTEAVYSYTANNISKIVTQSYSFGQPNDLDSISLVYDAQPNYFKKQDSYYLMTNPFFIEFDLGFLAFMTSEHNLIKAVNPNDPSDVLIYSYAADSRGNLVSVSEDGQIGLRYAYSCP